MAIYHCSAKIIGRSSGRSSVGAAAYRSGTKLHNEYDGLTHDFTRKKGIAHSEILLPPNAPVAFADRLTLWNAVEQIEKGAQAQLAAMWKWPCRWNLTGTNKSTWCVSMYNALS